MIGVIILGTALGFALFIVCEKCYSEGMFEGMDKRIKRFLDKIFKKR